VHQLARMPLPYEPDERWVCSFAHHVQAYLVESFPGLEFAEYCRRNIFQPLGMKDTVIEIPREFADRYPPSTPWSAAASPRIPSGRASRPDPAGLPALRAHAPERRRARLACASSDASPFRGLLLQPSATNGLRGPHGLYIIDTIILRLRVSRRVFSKHDMNLSLARHPGAPSGHGAMPFSNTRIYFLGFDWSCVCGSL